MPARKRVAATVKIKLEAGQASPGKVGQVLGVHPAPWASSWSTRERQEGGAGEVNPPAAAAVGTGWVLPSRPAIDGDTSMRVTSGRVATAAMLLVGLAALALAGRLLPSTPSTRPPATTGTRSAPAVRTAPGNTGGYAVPDVLGRTLAQAVRVLRAGGLHGGADARDPQGGDAWSSPRSRRLAPSCPLAAWWDSGP
jgi:hypothetical protein